MNNQHYKMAAASDKVSFKVYFKDSNEVQEEVRRFEIDRDVSRCFTYLEGKLMELFPSLKQMLFSIYWVDEESDKVNICSDSELVIAMTEMTGPLYKIYVQVKEKKPVGNHKETVFEPDFHLEKHEGVLCDSCNSDVAGFRYKCVVCPDYDLCEKCEAKKRHPGHNMIRIASPMDAMPCHFYRRMSKMQERFQRRAASMAARDAERMAKNCSKAAEKMCRNKAKKTEEKETKHDNESHAETHAKAHTDELKNVLDPSQVQNVWSSIMKGLDQAGQMNQAASNAAAAAAAAANGSNNDTTTTYLKNVAHSLFDLLDPLGVDVKIDVEQDGKKSPVKRQDSESNEEEEEKKSPSRAEKERKEETIEVPIKLTEEPMAKESEKKHDPIPEEEVDWTFLKDDDFVDASDKGDNNVINIPVNYAKEEKENVSSATDNDDKIKKSIEVPITVSEKPAKEIFDMEASASAVEEKDNGVAEHPNPKIEVALQAMMNMGFTNEGNWLAHLLETKDGDIGKVLDILQPIKPVRQ